MYSSSIIFRFIIVSICMMLSVPALAQTDCSAELAIFDDRIATSDALEQTVQVARQMRENLEQMCAFLDDRTRQSMLDGLEDLMPTKSREERIAEGRARSAELKATREARKREEEQAERDKPPVSRIILAPPTARSLAARLVDRDDIMYHLWIRDWDTYNGYLRVLYTSFPDRTQYSLPDWRLYVYVVKMTPAGDITEHLITSKQASDHSALALRRGYDEVIYQRHVDRPGEPTTLERWSVSDKRMISSVDITGLEPTIDGEVWQRAVFQMATSDGNLLYVAIKGGDRKNKRIRFGWFKLSPEGRLLGGGTASGIQDNVRPSGWFETDKGSGGLIVNISPVDGVDLASGLTIPSEDATSAAGNTAHVTREKRLLVLDADARLAWKSTAIERDIMPQGGPAKLQLKTTEQIQRHMQEQTQWMDSLTSRYHANRGTNYLNVGPHRIEILKPTDRGFAVLTTVTANRKLKPPIHGPYLLEVDEAGEQNEIYLNHLAEQMEIKLTTFAPAPNGDFYLHGTNQGSGDSHVILIDRQANPKARGRTSYDAYDGGARIEGMIADESGVWLFGHAYRNRERARLWVERLAFP